MKRNIFVGDVTSVLPLLTSHNRVVNGALVGYPSIACLKNFIAISSRPPCTPGTSERPARSLTNFSSLRIKSSMSSSPGLSCSHDESHRVVS